MEWLIRMNEAVNYIESNLNDTLDYEKAASIACCSLYHFQRMFSFISGVPLSEYVRRRRLTLAGYELQVEKVKIIDIAFKYGYDSPNSFTRAFQNLHGVTPSKARKEGIQLKAFPKISFHISIKGDVEMNYRIETKKEFILFGVEKCVDAVEGKCYRQIPEFWEESIRNGMMDRILMEAGGGEATIKGDIYGNEEMLLNAALYAQKPDGTFKYMICQNLPEKEISQDFIKLVVPELTWAIFPTERHTLDQTVEKIQGIWKRIFPEWAVDSGYEHADAPELEMYHYTGDGMFVSEVWIPVIKKQ